MNHGMRRMGTVALLVGLLSPAPAHSQRRNIDVAKSVMTVRVYKAGFFSAFAHNHEIAAPIAEGSVEASARPAVELRVDARKLRVLDPEVSADTRAKIQMTMESPQVLDASRFPEIRFRSTSVEMRGPRNWIVRGDVTLHGQTHPIAVDVTEKDGRYRGSATLKQRDFGIEPIRLAGGTVKVKDEVHIEFETALAK